MAHASASASIQSRLQRVADLSHRFVHGQAEDRGVGRPVTRVVSFDCRYRAASAASSSGSSTMPSWSLPEACTTSHVQGAPLSLLGACGTSAGTKI